MPEQALLSYEDLASFPDDGLRRELLDGVLLVSPSPNRHHQRLVGRLHLEFGVHLRAHGGGEVYLAPFDVVLSDRNVFEPDLLFVSEANLEIITDKNVQGPPSLAIEVLSDPRRDRILKHEAYARFAIPTYWIVDPESEWVEVYRLEGDAYGQPRILRPGDTLTFDALPGLAIDLRELFRLS